MGARPDLGLIGIRALQLHDATRALAMAKEASIASVVLDHPALGRQALNGTRQKGAQVCPYLDRLDLEQGPRHVAHGQPVRMRTISEWVVGGATTYHGRDLTEGARRWSIQ
jgi:hypothetical protein